MAPYDNDDVRTCCFGMIEQYLIAGALGLLRRWDERFVWSPGGDEAGHGCTVMAAIELGCEGVCGSLLLLASQDLVSSMCPRSSGVDRDIERELLGDTLGEFANMLLGRIKNRLVGHALEPVISTPTCVLADELVLPEPQEGMTAWHAFRAGASRTLLVRCTALLGPGFDLVVGAGEQPVLREGEVMMFDMAEVKR